MSFEYIHLLPQNFAPQSRVWIYQSSRLLTMGEALEMETLLQNFSASWKSHGADVAGWAQLFFGQFLVILADETSTAVSGCSTDASVRFVKEAGARYNVDFFNRTNLAFIINDKVEVLPMSQLSYAFENGFIRPETLYFNNLVQTRQELENNWIIPVKNSWLASRMPSAAR